jgi:hypothetical protein
VPTLVARSWREGGAFAFAFVFAFAFAFAYAWHLAPGTRSLLFSLLLLPLLIANGYLLPAFANCEFHPHSHFAKNLVKRQTLSFSP